MSHLTRRELACYAANQLAEGNTGVIDELAGYLIHERRLKEVDLLVSDIENLLAERNIGVAHVSSAHPLDTGARQGLIELLKHKLSIDTLYIAENIEPELIGGFKARAAGREIDTTLASKVDSLKRVKV